ncbi:MAG: putative 2-aminoethylphosphonate ABC transporter permease subunit [Caldilineae bacterium]|nr:MAG: putative 2-aminoethylphosphonate ABC transporter permease subunit [Caldilineae bacterium]
MELPASVKAPPRVRVDERVFKQRVRQRLGVDDVVRRVLLALIAVWLVVLLIYPLIMVLVRSLMDKQGVFVGLANYTAYFASPATSISLRHSLTVSVISMVITVVFAFVYAYGLARTTIPYKNVLRAVAMLPIFVPSLVQALAFIYMFGNNGVFTRAFGWNIGLYGPVGIVMSEVFYAFPHALIILMTALTMADARLHEAAESLGASGLRIFTTVTLPTVKYGLMSAAFVAFTLAITDFGAPKVVGGNYDVLATDIYNKVVGQQNFGMGATVSTLLLIPAVIAFVLDRIVQRRQVAQVTSEITPLGPRRHRSLVQGGIFVFCVAVAVFILAIYAIVIIGAFVKYWPYNLTPTLKNFMTFYVAGAHHRFGALVILWNSIKMATGTAVFGTIIVFASAYLIEKSRGLNWGRSLLYLLSIMPLAVPGMVLGLAYVFTFNNPRHPLYFLYGTMTILVLSTIIHYYTVPFLTAMTALKQMDPAFEAIGESLDAPFYRTFWRVTVPMAMPAILSIAMYFFLNAMVTLSAVVFLFVPGNELASLAVMLLDDAGETAQAMAMASLILVTGLTARGIFYLLTRGVTRRTQAWTQSRQQVGA